MSLLKGLTKAMSYMTRQESSQVGKFVWGSEGFKWSQQNNDKTPVGATEDGDNNQLYCKVDLSQRKTKTNDNQLFCEVDLSQRKNKSNTK